MVSGSWRLSFERFRGTLLCWANSCFAMAWNVEVGRVSEEGGCGKRRFKRTPMLRREN